MIIGSRLNASHWLLQVTMEQPSHLTIKDIGVILERLSAKIVDVERLERDVEGATYNWTIKVRMILFRDISLPRIRHLSTKNLS